MAVVKTVTATVSGKSEALLANTQGFTLYYRTSDTLNSVCSGTCASVWPPLLLPSGTPGSSQPLPGTLSVETNANGRQLVYNGHPLYLFKNDSNLDFRSSSSPETLLAA